MREKTVVRRAAYRGLMSDAVLDGLDVEERTEEWVEWLALPGVTILMGVVEDEVVGFSTLGPSRDTDSASCVTGGPRRSDAIASVRTPRPTRRIVVREEPRA